MRKRLLLRYHQNNYTTVQPKFLLSSNPVFRICIILSIGIVFFVSCKKEQNAGNTDTGSAMFYDQLGRTLILHGVSLYTNDDPGGYTRYNSNSAKRIINEWGFNTVRMFWSWNAIEPDSAVFAPDKLDSIVKVVEAFTHEGIYVVMAVNSTATSSQDKLRGTWQAPTGDVPDDPSLPGNTNPAQQEATRRFWDYTNYPYLQDEFIKASKYIAARLKDNPYVLGYDIMNEPWGDGVTSTLLNTNLESELLPTFYQKYITAMRSVEPDKYIFFEPYVLFNHRELTNFESRLPVIRDDRNGNKRLSFAPHCYLLDPAINTIQNSYDIYLDDLKNKYALIQQQQQTPVYIGEWSNIDYPNFPDAENYLNKHLEAFDAIQASWSYFGFFPPTPDDLSDYPALNIASRVYPMATSGKLKAYSYSLSSKQFNMSYVNDNALNTSTEIFLPKRYFPNGYNLTVSGVSDYTTVFDDLRNVLKIKVIENSKVDIIISPN